MTQKNLDVLLHPSFEFGSVDKPNLTDLLVMTDPERADLGRWIRRILSGLAHDGLNKPSWLRNGEIIHRSHVYQNNNVWHYHCGPYLTSPHAQYQKTDRLLSENNEGMASKAVYHYAKREDVIVVLGYSRSHVPFLDPNSTQNPIRTRAYGVKALVDKRR